LNNTCGTSASVSNIEENRSLRTVLFTCAAFHAKISADYSHFLLFEFKDFMRANLNTHTAVIAFFLDQLEADNFRIIS
jgi:hypothetical protein